MLVISKLLKLQNCFDSIFSRVLSIYSILSVILSVRTAEFVSRCHELVVLLYFVNYFMQFFVKFDDFLSCHIVLLFLLMAHAFGCYC
jgi:hypothetical protein